MSIEEDGTPLADKNNIRAFLREELLSYLTETGEKKYRAEQIYSWLWSRGAASFDEMTSLPAALREKLKAQFFIDNVTIEKIAISGDKTRKYVFRLFDGNFTEGVLIPDGIRITACISSQLGCQLGCKFCATGKGGFVRNLGRGEIYDQIKLMMNESESVFGRRLSNIVFMGMGEPLLNEKEVFASLEIVSSKTGLAFSASRITVSTVGIPDAMIRLSKTIAAPGLAVSVHAAIPEKREKLIPVASRYSLEEVGSAARTYFQNTGKKVTFEYLMLSGINDQPEDARALALFCKKYGAKLNLIPYNNVDGLPFVPSAPVKVLNFQGQLKKEGVETYIRKSRGGDIEAACGQLAGKVRTLKKSSNFKT